MLNSGFFVNRDSVWSCGRDGGILFNYSGVITMKDIIDKAVKVGYPEWMAKQLLALEKEELRDRFSIIIMTHQFLKAFFGEEQVCKRCNVITVKRENYFICEHCRSIIIEGYNTLESWQYHGMQLVLSTDRKSYLKRFI